MDTAHPAPTDTAVILARGLGTRMRAAAPDATLSGEQDRMASAGLKAMIDVGRPFLDHVMTAAADAGIHRFVLVIGPEHDAIRRYYGELDLTRVTVEFAVQDEPRGTGDAVRAAEHVVGDARFCLLNSDNFYPTTAIRDLRAASGSALIGFDPQQLVARGNIPAERVAKFALLEQAGGVLTAIHEKPDAATMARLGPGAPVSMNCFAFTPAIFEHAARLTPSARGEYEVTDAVRLAIAAGETFTVVPSTEGVLDMSSRGDIGDVAEALAAHEVRL